MRLFDDAGLTPRVIQVADEKQTIVNMVVARLGLAIVRRRTSRMAIAGVRLVLLKLERTGAVGRLPLSAAWVRSSRDPVRDAIISILQQRLRIYAKGA